MSFTQQLRREAEPIFQAIFQHEFIQGIARGDLGKEQLIHYVKQDYEYLNVYMRIYGLGISKCQTREDISMFHEKIGYILNSEIHPHLNLCRAAGVAFEDLQGFPITPTALCYTRHMLAVAHQGTLGEIYAVLLACPWTYYEAAVSIVNAVNPTEQHPFFEWIDFYANGSMKDSMQGMINRLDIWAQLAPKAELERMREHFMLSCQLELMFFEMAYKIEQWPVTLLPILV